MKSFKPGDRVKVIAGPRWGEVTTIRSPLEVLRLDSALGHIKRGEFVHELNLESRSQPGVPFVVAKPSWLEPYWEGREPISWSEELLNLCGIGSKAKEDA